MKKSIAILVNSFWVSGSGTSGGDQRAMQIFKRIGREFDVDIYTSDDGLKVYSKVVNGLNFIVSPASLEKGNILLRYRKRANWLIRKLAEKKYDIIYSSSDFFPDVLPAYKYKKKNLKTKWLACIFHIYPNWRKRPGNKIVNLVGTVIQNESFKKIGKLADKVININYQVQNELVEKYHFKKRKTVVNPCGIDLDYFRNIEAKKKTNQACFVARLAPSKGIFDLAEIWAEVVKKIPSAKLKIIGGGREEIKLKLKNTFDQKGISKNIEILGFLENDKAYKILKESAIFVFPSHEEGFGIAIAEAMACGVPAVTWDLPVFAEVFPKGLIKVRSWDSELFAQEVIRLMLNRGKLAKLAVEAEDVVKQYSWEQIAVDEKKIILC